MTKLFYSVALCAATLIGLSGCSSDPIVPDPVNPAVGIVNGEDTGNPTAFTDPTITGPTSIELDQLYTFTVTSPYIGDTFTFTVEDSYFNDPKSYAINVSTSGTRINVVFNDYGRYTITAKSNLTGKKCSYEVAKYYRAIRELKYCTANAPTLETGIRSTRPFQQWFERYANYNPWLCSFSGKMTNFEERIVINVVQKSHLFWFPWNASPYMEPGNDMGTITAIAAKGENVITLPDAKLIRHPRYNSSTLDYNAWYVPYCADRVFSIPEERCGTL